MKRFTTNSSILLALGVGLALVLALFVLSTQAAPPLSEVAGAAENHGTVPNAPAAELHVCPSGCTYSSIQDAVDAANDGDVIKVATGVYTGVQGRTAPAGYAGPSVITQVVYISKTVAVQGGYTTAFTDPPDPGANPTALDAQGQGRVLLIAGAITPTVEGLRITGGDAAGLVGSIRCGMGFCWNVDAGGGICIISATATISNNQVFSNTAQYGGGLHLYQSGATLSGNIVSASTASVWGGGLYLFYSDAMVSGNTIFSNTAYEAGGGLALWGGDTTLNGNTVTSNIAGAGGGLYLGGADATLSGNTISANTANGTGSWNVGGGLYSSYSNVTLINNVVTDNRANTSGSGLCIWDYSAHLLHTTIARNSGGDGSGVYASCDTVALTNTILVSHTVGVYVASGTTARLEGTLWGSGDWANGGDWSGDGMVSTGTVNLWGDPAFVDPDSGDYHIGPGSAAIDAGVDAGVTDDIDGDPRDDGYPDIGADETVELKYVYLPLVMRDFP